MTDLCAEFDISRKTGYKFWNRYQEFGPEGLYDESRRPRRAPNQTPKEIQQLILALKQKRPSWGAKKLKAELERQHLGLTIPAKSTIHELLGRHGLVRRRKRRRTATFYEGKLRDTTAPNEVWGADFKGEFRLGNRRYCYPLTATDHFSRYLLACEGLEHTRGRGARSVFKTIFREFGLPDAIRTDNGSPFASTGLLGLTQLSVWWLRLGIRLERIKPGHPEQNGRHERMHLTLKQETTRPAAANVLQQQEHFDRFRHIFNYERPHESLGMQRPAEQYKPSKRPFPESLPELEYPLHDVRRLVRPSGHIHLFRRNQGCYVCTALVGEYVGLREVESQQWLVSFMDLDLGHVAESGGRFIQTDRTEKADV